MSEYLRVWTAAILVSAIMSVGANATDLDVEPDPQTDPGISIWLEAFSGFGDLSDDGTAALEAGEDDDFGYIGGKGTLLKSFGSIGTQLDVFGEANVGEAGDDTYEGAGGGALHLNTSLGETFTVGAFGSVAGVGINDDDGSDRDVAAYIVGGEAMVGLNLGGINPIFFAQGGFLDSDGDDNPIRNAGFIRGGVKTTFAGRISLQGDIAYAEGEMGGNDDDVEIFAWGARGELHVPDTISVPLTLFVDYDGADYQQDGDNDQLIEHTFLFGISLHFGGDRAQDDAKRFDLPEYYRWVGQTGGALQ